MTRTRTALAAFATVTGAAVFWTASRIGAQEDKRTHAMFTRATTKWEHVRLHCRQVLWPPPLDVAR
jgi:hypothetical protein